MAKKTEKTDDLAPEPLMELDVEKMIRVVRGKQVLLDRNIATLYGVETRAINQAVKRNVERFPDRYCFQLEKGELGFLKSQKKIRPQIIRPKADLYPTLSQKKASICLRRS